MRHFKYLFLMILMIAVLLCDSGFVLAEVPKAPQTFKEAETMGKEILWGLPQALRNPWQEAVAVWGKMGSWFGNFWNSYITPWLRNIWQRVYSFLGKEVEKRKPEIQQKFEEEKQEMKEEIPKVTKSLWQRLKELIK